jgi:hypothetical protein
MKKILVLFLLFPVLDSYSQKWEKKYEFVDNCICGLSKVKKDGKIGYVNKEGVEIIKPQYNEGLTFNEGYTAVRMESNWMFFDSTGKAITDAIFEDAIGFKNGFSAVAKNNLYGYINTSGKVVIPFQFSNARSFSEGLAPAANAKGYWGYIDTKGEWIIKPAYDFTDNFENGEARVIKGDKSFYIDKQNKVIHD